MWLPIDQGLANHRKVWHLERLLQIPVPQIVGHLLLMWLWALDSAEDGRVYGEDSWTLEKAAGWTGEPGAFVAALITAHLVDQDADYLLLHDWEEYGGKVIESKQKDADRKRQSRARLADVTRTSDVDKTRQDRQDKKEETRQDRAPSVSQTSFHEQGEGEGEDAVDRAAADLLKFPQWTKTPVYTRHLLQQIVYSQADIDIEREVNAWRSEVLERREPVRDCEAALRGWLLKARPTEGSATSRTGR